MPTHALPELELNTSPYAESAEAAAAEESAESAEKSAESAESVHESKDFLCVIV